MVHTDLISCQHLPDDAYFIMVLDVFVEFLDCIASIVMKLEELGSGGGCVCLCVCVLMIIS